MAATSLRKTLPTLVLTSTSARWARTIAMTKKRAKIAKAVFRANVKKVSSDLEASAEKGMNAFLDFTTAMLMQAAW